MKLNHSFFACFSISAFNLLLALTHQANITVLTHFCLAASINFQAITSVTAFSNSNDNSFLSSKLNSHFSSFLLSTSLFILDFKPEKLKLNSLLTNQTLGNNSLDFPHSASYSADNLDITGPPGYSSHIIFAALSNASQPASSHEEPNFSKSNIDFI
jgi:hypothetical protein